MKIIYLLIIANICLVSCSDTEEVKRLNETIIENYDHLQQNTISEKSMGDQAINEMLYEKKLYERNEYHQIVKQKYSVTYKQAEKIDKSTKELIQIIERIKLKLLESDGENISSVSTDKSIIQEKFNPSKIETIIPLNLRKIQHKNSTDAVNKILISENEGQLSVTSNKLWKALAKYRKKIITDLACYEYGPEKYLLKHTNFTNYKSKKELGKKISLWLSSSKINRDDEQVIKDIYLILDFSKINNQHWINYTFKDIPITQAITNLTLLENKILETRNFALSHLRYRHGHCCYSFSEIKPLLSGPSVIEQGEKLELKVLIAAYDKNSIPEIEIDQPNSAIKDNFGYSIVTVKKLNKVGTQTVKGKISTKNNAGQTITKDWEWKVNVIPRK